MRNEKVQKLTLTALMAGFSYFIIPFQACGITEKSNA